MTVQKTYDFHPLADLFPPMEGAEFDALVADIKANGLHDQIVLYDGMILDGRNRYRACVALGWTWGAISEMAVNLDSLIDDVDGEGPGYGGPAAYVISANIHRRHLTPELKRNLIAKVIAAQPEKSDRQIAKQVKADHKTVAKARKQAEATGEASPVEKRTGADGKTRKQPAKKADRKQPVPNKPDPRIISPKLADRVGRFANDLILCDRLLAVELNNLIMLPGVRERLSADLTNGLALDDGAEPKGDDAL